MQTKIKNYYTIADGLKEDYPDLTEYQRLSLAVQIERNYIIENGLSVRRSDSDGMPSLEAIATSLGYAEHGVNLNNVFKQIVDELEGLNRRLKDIADK